MAGLTHPVDLAAWQAGQRASQGRIRRLRAATRALRRRPSIVEVATRRGDGPPRAVVVLDALTTTSRRALLGPLPHLAAPVAVVGPVGLSESLPPAGWQTAVEPADEALWRLVRPGAVVLSTGHYLALGALAHEVAGGRGARFVTVQHGLMTPHAPPLAQGSTLLAWSDEDADFWRSGRDDVSVHVVGSQLLWDAAERRAGAVPEDAAPVFLGQLHGAELPRELMARTAEAFCLETGATYRPHPAESDRRSRAAHRRWEAEGITVDRSRTPLRELGRPVVSVFSTGVLEAAAAGVPSWVHLPDPPGWVREFWTRYRLAPWGGEPTPSPERPATEPSAAVAERVRGMMSG